MNPSNVVMPELHATQQWMMAAITAPGGLPEGLEHARQLCGEEIGEIVATPPGTSPHKRLDIYAQGYWLRLFACLKADYPALQRLLGERLFEFFGRAYLANHPSRSFSLYDLGDGFARFLRRSQSRAAKAANDGKLHFPLELARIEQAIAASLRAPGLEDKACEAIDPVHLLLGGEVEIELPASTHLMMTTHPLDAFQPWLDDTTPEGSPETGTGYIAVARHRFRASCHALEAWQFHTLAAARRNPRPLLHCARAASRRCHRPLHEIIALLSLWLPTAQTNSLLKIGTAPNTS